jgi:hypothetical protein
VDTARTEHTIKATRRLPPEERVVFILALPTADTMAAARAEATTPADGDTPSHYDGERFVFAYLGRVVRGVRGLVRDGQVVEMAKDLDLDARIEWLRANLPSRWAGELIKAAESEDDVDAEEERSPSGPRR